MQTSVGCGHVDLVCLQGVSHVHHVHHVGFQVRSYET